MKETIKRAALALLLGAASLGAFAQEAGKTVAITGGTILTST